MWGWCWDKLAEVAGLVSECGMRGLRVLIPLPSSRTASPPPELPAHLWQLAWFSYSLIFLISRNLKPSPHHPYFHLSNSFFCPVKFRLGSSASLLQRATPNAHPSGQGASALRPSSPLAGPCLSPTSGLQFWGPRVHTALSPQDLELLLEGRGWSFLACQEPPSACFVMMHLANSTLMLTTCPNE